MLRKRVLCPERLRRIPAQFSWIDQRLVTERYVERCEASALALYLVLVTVADAQGLSYYGDARLARCLSLPEPALRQARAQLIEAALIAYKAPLYQVLCLAPLTPPRQGGLQPIRAVMAALPLQRRADAP